ncbi:MAG TPA: LuxR C-terminal-related transcriptional regulator [Candidatus Eisenbacteria bacterium]|nr:LuxR C-terminal-related transcriptional regulator [Candidatus Eisenbacteria bacterium]
MTILDGLMVEDPGAPDRASVLFALARARRDDLPTIERYCQEALRAAANDEGMQVDVLAFLSWMRLLRGAVADAVGAARSGLAIAERLGEAARLARAIARTSQAEMLALDVTPGLLDRGLAVEQSLDIQLEFHESPSITETQRLLRAGRLNEARQQLLECDARALDAGDEGTHGHLLFHLIQVETYAGRYGAALQYADAARELSEQLEDPQFRGLILATAARVEAHAGRMEDARRDAHAALEVAHRVGDALFEIDASTVLGFVELSLGNVPEAASWLAPLPDRLLGLGYRDPTHQAWSPATEALVAAGQLDLARRLVAEYRALAELSGSPRALGPAARVHGLLIMAEGRPEEALEAFDRSLAALAATTAPFEVARTHLASGVALRLLRRRGAARAALESARDSFAALGSTVWARRASQELGRLGGRRPAGSTLTPTQRRVATLAVDGRSNKEIAAAMGVSVNTVEAHLTAVYRALDVASRVELVHRLETTDSSKPEGPPA